MTFEYNPQECAEALPQDIAVFGEFIESSAKAKQEAMKEAAAQVNMKPLTAAVEAACDALNDMVKLFASMLGEASDGPKTGTLYGAKKLADELVENMG